MAKTENNRNPIAKRIRNLLDEARLNTVEAALKANIPKSTLANWVSGKSNPTDYDALYRLAKVLNSSISFILCGEQDVGYEPTAESEYFTAGPINLEGVFRIRLEQLITPNQRKKGKKK